MAKITVQATHKCGHTVTKDFKQPGPAATLWAGRIKRRTCNACHLAAIDASLQAVDLDTLRAVVRRCHNVPRLVAYLHRAAAAQK